MSELPLFIIGFAVFGLALGGTAASTIGGSQPVRNRSEDSRLRVSPNAAQEGVNYR